MRHGGPPRGGRAGGTQRRHGGGRGDRPRGGRGGPPEIGVVTVIRIDEDGTAHASLARDGGDDGPKIRINPDSKGAGRLRQGTRVLVRTRKSSKGMFDADIIRVLETAHGRLFGTVIEGRDGYMLESAGKGRKQPISLETSGAAPCGPGDIVEAELTGSTERASRRARVIDNLGPIDAPGALCALAIAEHEIPHVFEDEVIAETYGMEVPPAKGREDLRDLGFVTIDGADARDFDDAVFAEPAKAGGWRIMVAIADVAHYVRPGTALDAEARKRGNSVYLPGRVVPMLPEALSNGLCSLNPDEPRAAMVADIALDKEGNITSSRFTRALIRSQARLTYEAVQSHFDGGAPGQGVGAAAPLVDRLASAWRALDAARQKREPLALDLAEARVVFDDDARPVRIAKTRQSDSQRLIEDYMIAANVAAATTLADALRPCVFRVHDQPDAKKIEGLRELAGAVGSHLEKGRRLDPRQFNTILNHVKDSDDALMVNEAVLRCQARAEYTTKNIGHFGLALARYAHFTSPIRRYADLVVHRALIDLGHAKGRATDGLDGLDAPAIEEICKHISDTERRAASAERRTVDRIAATLMQGSCGTMVEGTIAGVTGAGLFVELDETSAQGFLPMRSLPPGRYTADRHGMRLTRGRGGPSLAIGDRVDVLVLEASPVSGGVLLSYGGDSKQPGAPSKGKGAGPGPKKHGKPSRAARKKQKSDRKSRPSGRSGARAR